MYLSLNGLVLSHPHTTSARTYLLVLSLFPAVRRSTDLSSYSNFCVCLWLHSPLRYTLLFVCHALILIAQLFRLDLLLPPMCITLLFYVIFYLVFINCSWLTSPYLCAFSLSDMYCTITHKKLCTASPPCSSCATSGAAYCTHVRKSPCIGKLDAAACPSRGHSCSCIT